MQMFAENLGELINAYDLLMSLGNIFHDATLPT